MDLNQQLKTMINKYGNTIDQKQVMRYVQKYINSSGLTKTQIKEIHNLTVQLATYFGKEAILNGVQEIKGYELEQVKEKINQSKELSEEEKKCQISFRVR